MFSLRENMLKKDIGLPPYPYDILIALDEKEYPKYLKRIFKYMTGDELNLKHPKTFNEKIQWLKLYDATPLKTSLTDKVIVRDWVKSKIGEEYLKPVLKICKNFDEIDFDSLPNSFIIKTNHGCKWHYKVKDKQELLNKPEIMEFLKIRFTQWLNTNFFPQAGFEMQYKDIKPQIIIENLMTEDDYSVEYEIYCFNSIPKIYQKVIYKNPSECSVYNEDFTESEICFNKYYNKAFTPASNNLKKAVELSKMLAKDFKLVRVDWLEYKNRIYFNEMTFTPFSGFFDFEKNIWNKQLGQMLKLSE